MRKTCVNNVYTQWITPGKTSRLYTQIRGGLFEGVGKARRSAQFLTHHAHHTIHSNFAPNNTVGNGFIPAVHSTYNKQLRFI